MEADPTTNRSTPMWIMVLLVLATIAFVILGGCGFLYASLAWSQRPEDPSSARPYWVIGALGVVGAVLVIWQMVRLKKSDQP